MTNTISRIIIMGSLITLTACGSSSDGDDNDTGGSGLKIYAESSQVNDITVDIAGTWITSCYQQGTSPFQQDIITISATGVFTYTTRNYLAGDTTCAGASTDTITFPTTLGIDATLTVDVEPRTMTGWRDGTGAPVSAPARADATGSLSANPDISQLDLTEASSVYSTAYYLDDTGATHVLYREDSDSQASNGYAQNISTADPLYKQ